MKDILLQGIPYDEKSSFLKGASLAPAIIRDKFWSKSSNTFSESHLDVKESFDDAGDKKIKDYFEIEKIAQLHLEKNQRLLTLGGDHSITYPIIRAYSKFYNSFDILHIDAHPDLYDELDDDKYSHACPFTRIMEKKLINKLIQVGIRTWTTHQIEQAQKYNIAIRDMKNFDVKDIPDSKNDVYISLDIDAFDPAFAPGVSHHEPGGLTSRQVISIIQSIKTRIIGADIVEYNPKRDVQGITAALAAKMMKEILSKMIENN
ncbi:MAG: agmatinase [Planctomycetia bacterium]|nr:agmatinase [Planctomycetia bacterium]